MVAATQAHPGCPRLPSGPERGAARRLEAEKEAAVARCPRSLLTTFVRFRHSSVEKIVMCEIDAQVCDVSKRFFANSTATSFNDPRVQLVHADAAQFVQDKRDEYDVVIVDSSDPIG